MNKDKKKDIEDIIELLESASYNCDNCLITQRQLQLEIIKLIKRQLEESIKELEKWVGHPS